MLSRWPIKKKLIASAFTLACVIGILAFSGLRGVYEYRGLARGISGRARELPLTAELSRYAVELSALVHQLNHGEYFPAGNVCQELCRQDLRCLFRDYLPLIEETLYTYKHGLRESSLEATFASDLGHQREEWAKLREIDETMAKIRTFAHDETLKLDEVDVEQIREQLRELVILVNQLPEFLQRRLESLADSVRLKYRTWIVLAWVATIATGVLLPLLAIFVYRWIFCPFRTLLHGSRRVAHGEFGHRIELRSDDEMAELARAMNSMTQRFQEVRDDLNQMVKTRTKQVVRSEQLASVGFLAAGVSHEINNPLQSIALCAESLEERLHDVIQADDELPDEEHNQEITVVRQYLRMIQDEAFRCKQITEKLLDFARLGESKREPTDLTSLVQDVVDMIGHLGEYKNKQIEFATSQPVVADVNAQEIKQVVLNLLTNGLDSLDCGGRVRVEIRRHGAAAQLVVRDDGCGMTDEVREHLFEPFFTRRRDGQGTGLGLSISYAIVQEHGGEITVVSEGTGCGSEFVVTIPIVAAQQDKESDYQRQAA